MKRSLPSRLAFTLAETLVATAIFSMVGAAIFVTSSSLMQSFALTEDYGGSQASMNRIIDYLATDLRSAEAVSYNGTVFTTGTYALAAGDQLVIKKPGFYTSAADESDYSAYALIAAGKGVVYGTSSAIAPSITITYTRTTNSITGEDIITRNGETIADPATNMAVRITAASSGREFQVSTDYFSKRATTSTAHIRSDVQLMVRNPRIDI